MSGNKRLFDAEEMTLLRSEYPKLEYFRIGQGGLEMGSTFFGMPVLLDVLPRRLPADHPMLVRLQCLYDPTWRREPRLAWAIYCDGQEAPPEKFSLGVLAAPWVRGIYRFSEHVALGHGPSGTAAVLCLHDERLVSILKAFVRAARLFIRARGYDPQRLSPADMEALG